MAPEPGRGAQGSIARGTYGHLYLGFQLSGPRDRKVILALLAKSLPAADLRSRWMGCQPTHLASSADMVADMVGPLAAATMVVVMPGTLLPAT
jgi:hypothetical protein